MFKQIIMNSCRYCSFKSKYKWVVERHIEKKHGTRVFSCGNCEFMTTSEGEMKEHKLKVHDIIYKGYAEVKEGDGVIKNRSWNNPEFKQRGYDNYI